MSEKFSEGILDYIGIDVHSFGPLNLVGGVEKIVIQPEAAEGNENAT